MLSQAEMIYTHLLENYIQFPFSKERTSMQIRSFLYYFSVWND